MKTNKTHSKIVSVILALAMVVTLLPTGFLGNSVAVQAASEYFPDYIDGNFSSDSWASTSSPYAGWTWGYTQQNTDDYEKASLEDGYAFQTWSSTSQTGAMYYTFSSLPAGEYTLSCTISTANVWASSCKFTLYPYVGGSQVTSYSQSWTSGSTTGNTVSIGTSFSYSFTLDSAQSSYSVGFYASLSGGSGMSVSMTNWSLQGEPSVTYSVASTTAISGTTVTTGTSTSDLQSGLASTITVNSTGSDSTSKSETLPLTWDLSNVNLDEAGEYEATYSYTSSYVGEGSGTVTIKVVDITDERHSEEIVTGSETTTVTKTETVDITSEVEWASGNVPGTFESGSLGTSTLTSNGFFASSTTYVSLSSSSKNNGSQSARMTVKSSSSSSNSGPGGNNNSSSTYYFYYGASNSASTTYSSLTSATLSSSSTFTSYSYTFTASATTMYLHFATIGATSSSSNNRPGSNSSSSNTYAYLRATLTGLTSGTTYTVTYYRTGYTGSGNSRYLYIDDVTVTYPDVEVNEYEEEETVETTATVYYDYAGTYAADNATVEVDATAAELAAALPEYVTADLVIDDDDATTYAEYLTDDDLTATQTIPVEWDTSDVDTSATASYTIEGTATYNGEEIKVETTLNVVEMGTIISAASDDDSYGAGCFENASDWTLKADPDGVVGGDDATDTCEITSETTEWLGANDGTQYFNVWSNVTGHSEYALYDQVYGVSAGTYTYSLAALGENISIEFVAASNVYDISTYTTIGTVNVSSLSASAWTALSGTFTYSGDDITGDYPGIGIKVTAVSGGGWGRVDSLNLTGPIYAGEEAEAIVIDEDNPIAVRNSDFQVGWKVLESSYFNAGDSSYVLGESSAYFQGYYWEDSDDYTEYDVASAYYNKLYTLTAGDYTMEAYVAGENVTVYPMIYYPDGTATVLYDYGTEVSASDWSSAYLVQVPLTIEETIENCYIGVYCDTSTAECWINMNGFSWYYGDATDQIWDDQPKNGDFKSGSIYPWLGENANDTTEDYLYGYTINQDIDGVDGYSLNLWNKSETPYEFTIYQNVRINTAGTYYFDYQAVGESNSDDTAITVSIADMESGDEYSAAALELPQSYYDWTEYIVGLDGVENTTYIADETDDAGFTVEEGTVVTLAITVSLGQYDYMSLDNIKFVQEGYTVEAKAYVAVDQFENAGFDSPWAVGLYWTGTGDIDESDDAAYGYKVISAYEATGDEDEAEDDAVYIAWNNDTESSHEYTLSQQISVTNTGRYDIKVDTRGWVYGSAVMTVTAEDGTVLNTTDVAPSSNDSWTTIESDPISIEGDQVITVTVTISLDAAELGGTWDDDGTEVEWYKESNIKLDNFVLEEYVQIEISGDGNYTPVKWTSSDGYTYYVNGGNYVKGVDMSSIISLEAAGTTFADSSGNKTDVFEVLKEAGVNSVRIRIWNDPYDTSGNTYGGGTNDAAVATMIAQRAADAGLGVMLSFHLSDFWADPSAQVVPKAWSSYTTAQKASATYTFVKETVEAVEKTGVDIQFVTIGNETTTSSSVAGGSSMSDLATIFVQGAQAVRDVDKKIMIGVHVAPTHYNTTNIYDFASGLKGANSSIYSYFDFFSTSCYPYWTSHGSTTNDMTNFATQLNKINSTYGLPTMITEYNWPYVLGSDQDNSGYVEVSTDSTNGGYTDGSYGYWNAWDISRQGQADMIQELNSYFAENVTDMMGTYYWEPTWIAAGNTSTSWGTTSSETAAINRWLTYGCGVATYYGATYLGWSGYTDPSTYSGSSVKYDTAAGSKTDEYSLFNVSGSAAASLEALGYSTDIMPIQVALAQVSTATDSKCSLRFVGEVALDSVNSYDSIGFKIEYCNSTGTSVKEITSKDTTLLYTKIVADSEEITPSDGSYYYAYKYDNIPTTGTYYFKVIATAKGEANYQQSVKYYKLVNGTLSVADAWDYPGTNATLSNTIYSTLYPSYMQ